MKTGRCFGNRHRPRSGNDNVSTVGLTEIMTAERFNDGGREIQPPPDLLETVTRFLTREGSEGEVPRLTALKGDGSARSFFRLNRGTPPSRSFVVMWNPPADNASVRENLACERIGKHLKRRGVPVPEIYHVDHRRGCVVMEDLGDTSLQDHLEHVEDPSPVFERVLEVLLRLQADGARGFDPRWCCQTPRYDRAVMILLEACYFREAFLRGCAGVTGDLDRLDRCFFHCAEMASRGPGRFFLHRDFQSRNIMVSGGGIRLVDWQGGRLGPPGYDIASLAIDPYTDLPDTRRDFLVEAYLSMLRDRAPSMADDFRRTYPYLAVQRNMQILGAFAYLSRVRGKRNFERYIRPALDRLRRLLGRMPDPGLLPLVETVREIDPAVFGCGTSPVRPGSG